MLFSLTAMAGAEPTAGDSYDFSVITQVFEYSQDVVAVAIDSGGTVKGSSLDSGSFQVSAVHKNPVNNSNVFSGNREVTKVYVNDTANVTDNAPAEGRYIIVELEHGFNVRGASTLTFLFPAFRNIVLDLDYTVSQQKAFELSDGTTVSAAAYTQKDVKNLIVDDFLYGQGTVGNDYNYRLFVPEKEQGKQYPLVVWLHGMGETEYVVNGAPFGENEAQIRANMGGTAWASPEAQAKNPAYVLAPQMRGTWDGPQTVALIKEIMAKYSDIDASRVYVVGCSMGGMGTWDTVLAEPDLFAAAMPICAAREPSTEELATLVNLPLWLFHATNDTTVNVANSRNATAKLEALNGNVKFTEFPNVGVYQGHWSWVPVLNDYFSPKYRTSTMDWLFKQVNGKNYYDVVTEVMDYGQDVVAVTINAGKPVNGSSIDADTFKVSAIHKNPNNGNVVFDGERAVTRAYVNDSGAVGVTAETGRFIVLELAHGFELPGASALVYASSRNVKLDMRYTLEEKKSFTFADGSPAALSYVQDEIVMPTLDIFDYIEYDGAFFRMYTPENAAGKALPLVLWNHGAGETYQNENNEGVQVLANFGGMGWVKNAPEDCYVLAPQRGYAGYSRDKVIAFIQGLIDAGKVDGDRVYVSGCSAGGSETWNYLLNDAHRDFFAAAITCPGGNNSTAEVLGKVKEFPIWMVQTGNDSYAATKAAYDKLSAMDANIKWTNFPVGYNGYPNDHWSWVPTLNNFWSPENNTTIMDWLFKQVRDKNNFDLITQVNEYGQAVVALAIDTRATVNAASVNVDTFDVSAITRNPRNLAVTFDGERKVTKAYVSNAKELGKPVDSGRYIILELEWGFNVAGSTALVYSSRNYRLYMDYTVTQNAAVDGLTFDLHQLGQIDLVVDDFEYIVYDDMFLRMYTPEEAADGKPLPLVLWNHGAGETYAYGTRADGTFYDDEASQILANMGGVGFVVNNDKYPTYVLAPQRGNGTGYEQSKVIAYINELIQAGKVDGNRVYIAGCSMGGGETLTYLANYPDFFAAAIPICPAGSPTSAQMETYKDVPMWFVQAANDPTVRAVNTTATVTLLRSLNPFEVKYSLYDSVFGTLEDSYNGHWSWVMVLNNDYVEAESTNYFDWLFAQSRNKVISNTEAALTNGEIVINVSTTGDVIGFKLEGETGRAISISSVTKTVGESGRIDWVIKTSVGTPGDRALRLKPFSTANGVMTPVEVFVQVSHPANAYEVISAKFDVKATTTNTPTRIEVVTGGKVSKINIQNTNNMNMGKVLVSKTANADGTITWVYTIAIGTAGEKRDFNVLAANAEGVYASSKPISIAVVKGF